MLTRSDLEFLLDQLDDADQSLRMAISLATLSIETHKQDCREPHCTAAGELEKRIRDMRVKKERAVLLKAKLLVERDSLEAEAFLCSNDGEGV